LAESKEVQKALPVQNARVCPSAVDWVENQWMQLKNFRVLAHLFGRIRILSFTFSAPVPSIFKGEDND
jgi:hypothetical protein